MAKVHNKKVEQLIKAINEHMQLACVGKKAYYMQTEQAIKCYLENFEHFNGNTTPLKAIFKPLGKDRTLMLQYIKAVSNIDKITVNAKGNFCIKLAEDNTTFQLADSFKTLHWYEKLEQADKSPVALDDENLLATLKRVLAKFSKDSATATESKVIALEKFIESIA